MNVSPYIEHAINNPASKIFYSAEDVIFDRRLSLRDKKLLLSNIELVENGLVHISRL